MKAVICPTYGAAEVLQIGEVPKPEPAPGEVLIRTYATTVTVADFRVRSFTVPRSYWLPARLALGIRGPRRRVLGAEVAGVVEAVGKGVSRFHIGDRIFAATLSRFGGYASYVSLPADGPMALMPDNISFEEAAALPVGARTALHYMRRGKVSTGTSILIYGASGSVGTYAVQLAKHIGAEITAVCSKANHEWVQKLGATTVIDYQAKDFESQLGMYDVILVAIDKLPWHICKRHLKHDGVYLNITEPFKSLPMLWTSLTTSKRIVMGEHISDSAADLEYLAELAAAGHLKAVIDRQYPLEEIVEAHRYVEQGHKKGNVTITIG